MPKVISREQAAARVREVLDKQELGDLVEVVQVKAALLKRAQVGEAEQSIKQREQRVAELQAAISQRFPTYLGQGGMVDEEVAGLLREVGLGKLLERVPTPQIVQVTALASATVLQSYTHLADQRLAMPVAAMTPTPQPANQPSGYRVADQVSTLEPEGQSSEEPTTMLQSNETEELNATAAGDFASSEDQAGVGELPSLSVVPTTGSMQQPSTLPTTELTTAAVGSGSVAVAPTMLPVSPATTPTASVVQSPTQPVEQTNEATSQLAISVGNQSATVVATTSEVELGQQESATLDMAHLLARATHLLGGR